MLLKYSKPSDKKDNEKREEKEGVEEKSGDSNAGETEGEEEEERSDDGNDALESEDDAEDEPIKESNDAGYEETVDPDIVNIGTENENALLIQQRLNKLGAKLNETGIVDKATEDALYKFTKLKLPVSIYDVPEI
jgi:hypothetical protein